MAPLRELWLRWKMLRLPWRKTFLIGQDLNGNTFWEFRDQLHAGRFRRIAKPRRRTNAHSDLQISPQWHQWLRQTRIDPPTIQEQHGDIVRIAQLKHNAKLADERWANKERYIEKPKARTPLISKPAVGSEGEESDAGKVLRKEMRGEENAKTKVDTQPPKKETKTNPWAQSDAGSKPGSKWQPEGWVPGAARR